VGENVLQCKLNMVFCCSASGTGALPLNSKKKQDLMGNKKVALFIFKHGLASKKSSTSYLYITTNTDKAKQNVATTHDSIHFS
jgi:hypothetical protein